MLLLAWMIVSPFWAGWHWVGRELPPSDRVTWRDADLGLSDVRAFDAVRDPDGTVWIAAVVSPENQPAQVQIFTLPSDGVLVPVAQHPWLHLDVSHAHIAMTHTQDRITVAWASDTRAWWLDAADGASPPVELPAPLPAGAGRVQAFDVAWHDGEVWLLVGRDLDEGMYGPCVAAWFSPVTGTQWTLLAKGDRLDRVKSHGSVAWTVSAEARREDRDRVVATWPEARRRPTASFVHPVSRVPTPRGWAWRRAGRGAWKPRRPLLGSSGDGPRLRAFPSVRFEGTHYGSELNRLRIVRGRGERSWRLQGDPPSSSRSERTCGTTGSCRVASLSSSFPIGAVGWPRCGGRTGSLDDDRGIVVMEAWASPSRGVDPPTGSPMPAIDPDEAWLLGEDKVGDTLVLSGSHGTWHRLYGGDAVNQLARVVDGQVSRLPTLTVPDCRTCAPTSVGGTGEDLVAVVGTPRVRYPRDALFVRPWRAYRLRGDAWELAGPLDVPWRGTSYVLETSPPLVVVVAETRDAASGDAWVERLHVFSVGRDAVTPLKEKQELLLASPSPAVAFAGRKRGVTGTRDPEGHAWVAWERDLPGDGPSIGVAAWTKEGWADRGGVPSGRTPEMELVDGSILLAWVDGRGTHVGRWTEAGWRALDGGERTLVHADAMEHLALGALDGAPCVAFDGPTSRSWQVGVMCWSD